MALVKEFTCRHCKRECFEVATTSNICAACRTTIGKANEEAHLAKLLVKPLKERVRAIELALYRLDADARLKKLEITNTQY